jgi:hypothetical protein
MRKSWALKIGNYFDKRFESWKSAVRRTSPLISDEYPNVFASIKVISFLPTNSSNLHWHNNCYRSYKSIFIKRTSSCLSSSVIERADNNALADRNSMLTCSTMLLSRTSIIMHRIQNKISSQFSMRSKVRTCLVTRSHRDFFLRRWHVQSVPRCA